MFISIKKQKLVFKCSSCNYIFEQEKQENFSSIFIKQEIISSYDLTCPKCHTNFNHQKFLDKIKMSGEIYEIEFDLKEHKNKVVFYKITRIVSENLKITEKKQKIIFNIPKRKIKIGLFKTLDLNNIYEFLEKLYDIPDDIKIKNADKIIQLTKIIIDKDIDNPKYIHKINNSFEYIYQGFFINFKNLLKLNTVVFSIFLYQNLSTLLIEKNMLFVFDLIKHNKKITKRILKKNKITNPVKLFSYLSKNIIEYLLVDIYREKELLELINIKSDEKFIKRAKLISKTNNIQKLNINIDKIKITKFIFKNINDFENLKRTILMFKFFELSDIVYLFNKVNDNIFLLHLIERIIDRDKITPKKLLQLYYIVYDFCLNEQSKKRFSHILEREIKNDFLLTYIDDFDFSLYDDTIMILEFLNIPLKEFNKIKSFSELVDFHDKIVTQFNALKNIEEVEKFSEFTKLFEYLNYENNEIKVKVITSVKELIDEGKEMKHSAGSYSKKIAQRQYLILSVYFEDERATAGLIFRENFGLRFHQLKGVANKKINEKNIKIFKEYLKEKNIDYSDNDNDIKIN